MREAHGHVKLLPVVGAQNDSNVAPEGRRTAANIDCDVEDAAARAADQFCLRSIADLEMQTSDRAHRVRQGMVLLDELHVDGSLLRGILTPDLGKKAAAIPMTTGRDHSHSRYPLGSDDVQRSHR